MSIDPIHYRINPAPPNSPVFIRIDHTQAKPCVYDCDADESESDEELHEECTQRFIPDDLDRVDTRATSAPIQIPTEKKVYQTWNIVYFGD